MTLKFKRLYTTLDDYNGDQRVGKTDIIRKRAKELKTSDLELSEGNVVSYTDPVCPACDSKNVIKNGKYIKILENGVRIYIQRYLCKDCGKTFETRLPGYEYKKHISEETKEKGIKTRVKTSLRKAAEFLRIIGEKIVSHEFLRRIIPKRKGPKGITSNYFVYDEQYVEINGVRKYRALMKDVYTEDFYEEILGDLTEQSIISFMINALDRFQVEKGAKITITTDGWHYKDILKEVARIKSIRIRRSRCLVHILRDLSIKIEKSNEKNKLKNAMDLVTVLFFPLDKNIENLEMNKEYVKNSISGKNEIEIVETMRALIERLYGEYKIIKDFLEFLDENEREVFLYLKDPAVPKTTNVAESHFSLQSWLFKHRFKTTEGLLDTSYWYHILSTKS